MAKLVVTGESEDGRCHANIQDITYAPMGGGFWFANLWGADEPPGFPNDGAPQSYAGVFPAAGGYRFLLMCILPGERRSAAADGMIDELSRAAGGVDPFAGEAPGMHRSDTVDLGIVLSGRLNLELPGGEVIELSPGDSFIQNGTDHQWSNPGEIPVTVAVAIIGGQPRG